MFSLFRRKKATEPALADAAAASTTAESVEAEVAEPAVPPGTPVFVPGALPPDHDDAIESIADRALSTRTCALFDSKTGSRKPVGRVGEA